MQPINEFKAWAYTYYPNHLDLIMQEFEQNYRQSFEIDASDALTSRYNDYVRSAEDRLEHVVATYLFEVAYKLGLPENGDLLQLSY